MNAVIVQAVFLTLALGLLACVTWATWRTRRNPVAQEVECGRRRDGRRRRLRSRPGPDVVRAGLESIDPPE